MAELKVDAALTLDTSHGVNGAADELRAELGRIARGWDDISSKWSGAAASAFASQWEDWHDGATRLVEILAESTRRLGHAAATYQDRENRSATMLQTMPVEIGL